MSENYASLRAALKAALAIEHPNIPSGNTERVFRALRDAADPATIAALLQERDDLEADYLRRHKDACDRLEQVQALTAERDALSAELERLREDADLVKTLCRIEGYATESIKTRSKDIDDWSEDCEHIARWARAAIDAARETK